MNTHGTQARETILLPLPLQAALRAEVEASGQSLCRVVRMAIENELRRRAEDRAATAANKLAR